MCTFNILDCGKVEFKYKLKFWGQKDLDLDFFSFNNAVIIVQDTKIFLKYFFATVSPFFWKNLTQKWIYFYIVLVTRICVICVYFLIVVVRIRKSTEHLWFNMNNLYLNLFFPVIFQIWYGDFGFSVLFSVRFPFCNF